MIHKGRGAKSRHVSIQSAAKLAAFVGIAAIGALAAPPAPADNVHVNPASNAGPVRLARFSIVEGDVNWRPDDQAGWSRAVRNLPVRQGCEISTAGKGRAELQFDDGSRLRMGNGAVVTFTTLYSDADGEFTQVALRNGAMSLRLTKAPSVYQIDTPIVSLDATGPTRCRIDAVNGVQVGVREGKVVAKGDRGECSLVAGNYLDLRTDQDPYEVRSLPQHDSFDDWDAKLYISENRYLHSPHRKYLPSNVALVSDNLDDYGDWRYDRHYGRIWHPRVRRAGWRPYHDGHWVWVDPFGWTWVDDDPWGWATCHYGTWVHEPYGWCWDPGPDRQYWCPAVVDYCDTGDSVAWCPLAPAEVRYPSTIEVGFRDGDWSAFFSIGGACVYYPTSNGYCEPRPWSSGYVNSVTYLDNVTNVYNGGAGRYRRDDPGFNHNTFVGGSGFMPVNARYAAGASLATAAAFGGRGNYQALPRNPTGAFRGGRFVGAPGGSFSPVAGPRSARPGAIGMTATRAFRSGDPAPRAALTRAVRQTGSPVQNMASARQLITRSPARARAAGSRVPGSALGGRTAGIAPQSQPSGAGRLSPGGPGRPSIGRAPSGLGQMPGLSREQNAALRARNALGVRTRLGGGQAAGPSAQFHRTQAGAVASGLRAGSPRGQRPNAAGALNTRQAAAQARMAVGNYVGTRPNGQRLANARQTNAASPRTGGRQAAANRQLTAAPQHGRANPAGQNRVAANQRQARQQRQPQANNQARPQRQARAQFQQRTQGQARAQIQQRPQRQARAQIQQRPQRQGRQQFAQRQARPQFQQRQARPQVQRQARAQFAQRPQFQRQPRPQFQQRQQSQPRPQFQRQARAQFQPRPQQQARPQFQPRQAPVARPSGGPPAHGGGGGGGGGRGGGGGGGGRGHDHR